jgi:serine/threonine-protein kinase
VQQRGAAGNTTVSRVKTLLLHVQACHGQVEADALLLKTKLDRDYLEDETRALPIELWHGALVAFASRWGRDELIRIVPSVVHPENLGVWTRVLRGAHDPAAAFRQLDQYGGDDVLTERWQTLLAEPGVWRGRIGLRGDISHERDGLCALARAAELAAVPLLFGLRPGQVEPRSSDERTDELTQQFEVRWRQPDMRPAVIVGGLAAAASATAAASFALSPEAGIPVVAASSVAGAGVGILVVHERRRRAQAQSQLTRIQVLERAATLRDSRERGATVLREGSVISGQYRLGEKLGVGASGAIWEAERLSDGTPVAIKLLRAAVAHDTLAADRLRREAAALGLAWHPNVVEVYDEGQLPDGTTYLVMERLWGESLAMRLKQIGPLPGEQLLPIALQVCDALGAVHAAGVVHRDLKPSNIFLARPQEPPAADDARHSLSQMPGGLRVKLLDFGVARVEWAETRLTNMGAPLGTPGYMSPEQEQGLEIDQRSDLFSLGAVLYECLTGQLPPLRSRELWERGDGTSESGVQRAFQSMAAPWRRVLERAMAELPRDRFSDARAMREALVLLASDAKGAQLGSTARNTT